MNTDFFFSQLDRGRKRFVKKKIQFSTYSKELNDQILYEILISISLFIETPLKVKRTKISLAQNQRSSLLSVLFKWWLVFATQPHNQTMTEWKLNNEVFVEENKNNANCLSNRQIKIEYIEKKLRFIWNCDRKNWNRKHLLSGSKPIKKY